MRRIIALAAAAVAGAAAPAAEARTHYIFTVAGSGASGFDGDGGPATRAALDLPRGLAWLPRGGFLVAEANNNVVRRVSSGGTIRTVAGDGAKAYGGD
ncbi:MAG: protein kinase domain-containing protein, partial [Solirubrobacteraceae bacterium]